nr:group II intron maturase-specific domain-containing protein [Ectothiorhodospira haloalkaliphila]
MAKVRSLNDRNNRRALGGLLLVVNRVLQRWCRYFRYGVSVRAVSYLGYLTWHSPLASYDSSARGTTRDGLFRRL